MKDFDTLRHRVEETAERLSTTQSERQEQTQSLIGMLSQLEEKYSAQEQQFTYYRDRLKPLEQSNAQLTSLMENLLDLIDRGFGEGSLEPMRQASAMASAMLETDVQAISDSPPDQDINPDGEASMEADADTEAAVADIEPEDAEPEAAIADAEPETSDAEPEMSDAEPEASEAEPVMATFDDIEDDAEVEGASQVEEDVQVIEDLVELIDADPEVADQEPVAVDDEEAPAVSEGAIADEEVEDQSGEVADLELEEEPLSYLDEDIEVASETIGTDIDAIAAADLAADEEAPAWTDAEDASQSPTDLVSGDDVVASDDVFEAEVPDLNVQFEDVSDAVLELETEEDANSGFDDLPDVVKIASAAHAADDASLEEIVPPSAAESADVMTEDSVIVAEQSTDTELASADDTADEVETIAALAHAMEEETSAENAPPPAPSDIRSLLLRVEALAKKAEGMRLVQGADMKSSDGGENAIDEPDAKAATETDKKDEGVAA